MEDMKIASSGWDRAVKATADDETIVAHIFKKASVENPSHDFIFSVNVVDATGTPKAIADAVVAYDKTTGKVSIDNGPTDFAVVEGDLFWISGIFVR